MPLITIETMPTWPDVRAGRLLARLSQAQLAAKSGITTLTINKIEHGQGGRPRTLHAMAQALADDGVLFVEPGDVRHVGGERAPTPEVVGRLSGDRLRRARMVLGYSDPVRFAVVSGFSPGHLRKVEALAYPLEAGARPETGYILFNALERLGYRFERDARKDHATAGRA